MREIGIGVIGTAFMGKAHSIAYSAAGTVFGEGLRPRLEMVCDIDAERAERKRVEMGYTRATTNYLDVINDPAVELISICAPNDVHMEIAVAALNAGKHVWCEKPMATSVAEAEAMLEAARNASGQQTILGYNYTQNPLVAAACELIAEGAIGEVTGFYGVYDVDNEADPDRPFSWRMSREASGTGANADVMCHLVSIAHRMTDSDIIRVVGDYDTVHKQRLDPASNKARIVDNDDVCMAIAHFANGIKGTLRVSRVAWGRKCGLRWEVHGSQGMITHDQERLNELKLYTRTDDPRQQGFRTILSGQYHKPYDAFLPNAGHTLGYIDVKICELHQLLTAIESGKSAWPNFEDGIKIERVMDAIDRSALSGQWVDV